MIHLVLAIVLSLNFVMCFAMIFVNFSLGKTGWVIVMICCAIFSAGCAVLDFLKYFKVI